MPNFTSENKGAWFYFDPTDESLGGVCLRELTPGESRRIEKLTVRTKKKFKRGTAYEDTNENKDLAFKLRWDFCIVGWKEVALDGVQLECNKENKVKMMEVVNFVKFVVDSLEELIDSNSSLQEARLKNLESSSSGE